MTHVPAAPAPAASPRLDPLSEVPARLVVTLEDRGDSRTPGRFRLGVLPRASDDAGDDERVVQRR